MRKFSFALKCEKFCSYFANFFCKILHFFAKKNEVKYLRIYFRDMRKCCERFVKIMSSCQNEWLKRPGQARPGQARLGQARLGQARLGQARPGQARLGQARLGQARPGGNNSPLPRSNIFLLSKLKGVNILPLFPCTHF